MDWSVHDSMPFPLQTMPLHFPPASPAPPHALRRRPRRPAPASWRRPSAARDPISSSLSPMQQPMRFSPFTTSGCRPRSERSLNASCSQVGMGSKKLLNCLSSSQFSTINSTVMRVPLTTGLPSMTRGSVSINDGSAFIVPHSSLIIPDRPTPTPCCRSPPHRRPRRRPSPAPC